MRRTLATTLAAGLLAVGAAVPAAADPPERTTIVDAALQVNADTGEFDELIGAVTALGLVDALDGQRQFTVFAPTDAAFEALYAQVGVADLGGLVAALGVDTVRDVVLYHVAPGERLSGTVATADQVNTLNGEKIPVEVTSSGVHLDEATLLQADVDVDNGVIHVIDAVMLPSALS
jgi:transforming growth factor-beta-induced protein